MAIHLLSSRESDLYNFYKIRVWKPQMFGFEALEHLMELASSQGCLWAPQDILLCKFDLHNVSQNTCIDIYFTAYQIGGSETVICPRSPFWNISFKLWIQKTEHSTTQTQIYNEREIFFQSVPADCQCPKTDFQFGNLLQTELG